MKPPKVVHMSSHHNPIDNRIFFRECRTLAEAGYDVSLVVRNDRDEVVDGVKLVAVDPPSNRLQRVTCTAYDVFRKARAIDADVYHFHDPELIPWGLALRALGKPVIYDVHEDFAQAAGVRSWIPRPLRRPVSAAYSLGARAVRSAFEIVIAERYYARTFPGATPVLNYPHVERSTALRAIPRSDRPLDKIRMVYVGNLSESRGTLLHAELANLLPGCHIHFSGQGTPDLAQQVRELTGDATIGIVKPDRSIVWEHRSSRPASEVSTVVMDGIGFYVHPELMIETFAQDWTCALSVFPKTEHYYEKELTKFFEYMAAGLPLIVSNFPNWRALVEPVKAGIAVDPANLAEVAAAVRRLDQDRSLAFEMGENGRKAAVELYSWASQRDNLLGLYDRLAPLGNS
jgi:glycosyltransferase involved in cell wall biosynthesis